MAPIAPQAPPTLRAWLVWLAVAVALLMVKPWGAFSWDEWLVIAAPLLLLHPVMRQVDVFVIGLVGSLLAWYLLSDRSGGWMEIACLLTVLLAGTLLGNSVIRGGLGKLPPGVGVGWVTNEKLFFDALNRELCRVRRDRGSFAVLSVDLVENDSDAALNRVFEFLDEELRAYADIALVGKRILALVPEVADGQPGPLLRRLKSKWDSVGAEGELRIGLTRFPEEAICAGDLIELADRKRLVKGIAPVKAERQPGIQGQVSM